MRQRQLGELTVSALGLGCMGLSEFYGDTNNINREGIIQAAFDQGVNFFDTADMYGSGDNEQLVGRATKSFRGQISIATKFGIVRNDQDASSRGLDGSASYVAYSVYSARPFR